MMTDGDRRFLLSFCVF